MRMRAIYAATSILFAAAGAWAQEIAMSAALVVEGVGTGGRTLVQTDAVEALRVRGEWNTPAENDQLTLPDGATRTWQLRQGGQDGWIRVRGGGYACWSFESDAEKVMILEASGHGSAMVNNEPRVGDPYELGYVRLPVLVKKGANEILLKSGRGRVRAKLVDPPAEVFLNLGDMTMPDLLDEPGTPFGAIIVVNATRHPLEGASVEVASGGAKVTTPIPTIPALATRKVRVDLIEARQEGAGEKRFEARIVPALGCPIRADGAAAFTLGVRKSTDKHKRTFISDIDGSVQYYAVVPPPAGTDLSEPKALILSLHGASVEATNQANCYKQRDWCYVVCPTNRRPFGFDWEDWGRTDALEVLGEARRRFELDGRRTYLTGHSMGGHGTWNIGVQFPGTFAALGPSAGWISFWSYTGGANRENVSEMEKLLLRAACTSDTLAMKENFAQQGIYILHGDADDNVPVGQARTMRKELAEFHPNFAYYEQPGAGHWWGDQCVDWDPMIEFFRRHVRPETKDITKVEFTTVNPGVSASCDWVSINGQVKPFEASRVEAGVDRETRRFTLKTVNVAEVVLAIEEVLPGDGAVSVMIDGQTIDDISTSMSKATRSALVRTGETWSKVESSSAVRPSLFKSAFGNKAILVHGTSGDDEADAALAAKARFDAETFWYRGNGDFRVMSDVEYLRHRAGTSPMEKQEAAPGSRHASVVLYGNADTNGAWSTVLGETPAVSIRNGSVAVDGRVLEGDSYACLFLAPMEGDATATVGVVGGTGLAGMRLTDRLPYFVSGVGVPDWVVLSPELLTKGVPGLRGAGFFGRGGTTEGGESVWAAE